MLLGMATQRSASVFAGLAADIGRTSMSSIFDSAVGAYDGLVVAGATGLIAERTLAGLKSLGIVPLALIDNNRLLWGASVQGVTVLSPQEGVDRYPHAVFVVSVFTHSPFRRQLRGFGAERVISYAPLFHKWPNAFLPYFAVDSPDRIVNELELVNAASTLWADTASAELYAALIRWFATLDSDAVPDPLAATETYFPDLIAPYEDEVFVDCGAFDGDTVDAFRRASGNRYKNIVAFEPDPINFANLVVRGRQWRDFAAVNAAVGQHRGRLAFRASGALSSHATTAGADGVETAGALVDVDMISIDDLRPQPSFVKMDIEGGELQALAGAMSSLSGQNCVFAITLYHRMRDLWCIPLFIHRHAPGLRLFLRHYAEDWAETVCYAVPAGRVASSVDLT
jgi:FkbM family methyltransferase